MAIEKQITGDGVGSGESTPRKPGYRPLPFTVVPSRRRTAPIPTTPALALGQGQEEIQGRPRRGGRGRMRGKKRGKVAKDKAVGMKVGIVPGLLVKDVDGVESLKRASLFFPDSLANAFDRGILGQEISRPDRSLRYSSAAAQQDEATSDVFEIGERNGQGVEDQDALFFDDDRDVSPAMRKEHPTHEQIEYGPDVVEIIQTTSSYSYSHNPRSGFGGNDDETIESVIGAQSQVTEEVEALNAVKTLLSMTSTLSSSCINENDPTKTPDGNTVALETRAQSLGFDMQQAAIELITLSAAAVDDHESKINQACGDEVVKDENVIEFEDDEVDETEKSLCEDEQGHHEIIATSVATAVPTGGQLQRLVKLNLNDDKKGQYGMKTRPVISVVSEERWKSSMGLKRETVQCGE